MNLHGQLIVGFFYRFSRIDGQGSILHCPTILCKQQSIKEEEQVDQIGRIFDHWGTVYLGQCFENYESIP
jgi:hypothetical protein